MQCDHMLISVIVPFYHGNKFLNRLMESIQGVAMEISDIANVEVIIVNDSPEESVELPQNSITNTFVYSNKKNSGIQKSRVNGLKKASGEWIVFLDQDDELIRDGFRKQIELAMKADVVVGNGYYHMGTVNHKIYKSTAAMRYLIQKDMFIEIRNLIPSPGECLIKKKAITEQWKKNILNKNGADDWFLWITLFYDNVQFEVNEECVYRHNDSGGMNLSADLTKMRDSSLEMADILEGQRIIPISKVKNLRNAIEFKYHQDSKTINLMNVFHFIRPLWKNICYKFRLFFS